MLMVDYYFNLDMHRSLFIPFLVPSNVEKFGCSFARAIRFNFKEHIRLSTWIESKMFGSPPDDGMNGLFFLVFDDQVLFI